MLRILHLADVHIGASMSAFGDAAEARRRSLLEAALIRVSTKDRRRLRRALFLMSPSWDAAWRWLRNPEPHSGAPLHGASAG
jgi:hypothetical protein